MSRFLTLSITIVAGLLALPVMLIVAFLVLASLGRPIFYTQWRMGREARPFLLTKFRTMAPLADADGSLAPDEMRVTRIGRLLRRTRLDELPELLNILRGEMALVGPRPLLPETIASMGRDGWLRGRVLPGLTGWAQVNGNTLLTNDEKLRLDLWYAAHRTMLLDLTILLRTVLVILLGEKKNSRSLEVAIASGTGRRR